MTETKYPYGYSGAMLTRKELESKQTVYKLQPEFWRRYIALMEFAATKGIKLGVGTGWRIQPNPPPPGFAPPGNSNHEGFMEADAVAIDSVPAPAWDEIEGMLASFGLKSFRHVNDEPWHIQPIEIPNSRSYRKEPWNLKRWDLPTDTEEDDMPLSDEDVKRIAKAVWDEAIVGDTPDENKPARWRLKMIQNTVRYYLGGVKESTPLPEKTLLKQINENTKP